ncbi:DUF1080 domain-containing protein [Haloferula sp. BvORR071]|uniref:3-keto-disaccharide hydrolase n=1 Tax=Haloferula sp. BvORR071 TaxID=1396141 RepID=UPI0005565CAA|nr:DUF1080 domain-containing protein [Haloferula sp. BvORR071]
MPRPLLSLLLLSAIASADPVPLFDGKTLEGWEGDTKVWRVEDGAIVGGSMEGNARNEFLTTKQSYKNFILRLEYKLVGTEGFVNGGVQFHSQRAKEQKQEHEMIGYQADIGAGYSGCLNNELRKPQFLGVADKAQVKSIEKPGEWNRYEIRVEGPRVQLSINGTKTSEYTEKDPAVPLEGLIGLQIHGNCKAVISFRKIEIESLPDTPK